MRPDVAKTLDLSAIGLTAICLVHCLALPILALAMPLFATWAAAEWLHALFVMIAAPLALLAMMDWPTRRPTSRRALALAIGGLILMTVGALGVPSAAWERPLTAVGGLFLAGAHVLNLRARHANGACRSH